MARVPIGGDELTASEELLVQNATALSAAGAGEFLRKTGTSTVEHASASSSGANTALSNLASVAINTSLLLGTSDGGALGSTTKMWSDLFLASGAVINFNSGDVTITHSANALDIDGGVVDFGSTPTVNSAAIYYAGGTDVPVTDGGTGASTTADARTNLGLVIGTHVQAYDATLASLAALGTAADKFAYTTGIDTWAEAAVTSFGRSLIDDADATTARTTLGLNRNL